VPHAVRLIVGIDHRWLMPFSAVLGAALLTGADVVGRIVARPGEVDVGIITALIGAPFFIYIVRRQKVRAL
jgi:iron complex transport system permease protein